MPNTLYDTTGVLYEDLERTMRIDSIHDYHFSARMREHTGRTQAITLLIVSMQAAAQCENSSCKAISCLAQPLAVLHYTHGLSGLERKFYVLRTYSQCHLLLLWFSALCDSPRPWPPSPPSLPPPPRPLEPSSYILFLSHQSLTLLTPHQETLNLQWRKKSMSLKKISYSPLTGPHTLTHRMQKLLQYISYAGQSSRYY